MILTEKEMQLDVEVSPPANIMSLSFTLTHITFDLDPSSCPCFDQIWGP